MEEKVYNDGLWNLVQERRHVSKDMRECEEQLKKKRGGIWRL